MTSAARILLPAAALVACGSCGADALASGGDAVTKSYVVAGAGFVNLAHELRAPSPTGRRDEDEVELYYPTTRRVFRFPHRSEEAVGIRQTSFGCGKLGANVWPSSIALASLLANGGTPTEGRRVLELGAGCGLPSATARICGSEILATDYWEQTDENGNVVFDDKDRLVPKSLFGQNLVYNVGGDENLVSRLDWFDEMNTFQTANHFQPDLVIGADLVYYPSDAQQLMNTIEIMLKTSAREALLISPLSPEYEREALPEFRRQLEGGVLGDSIDVYTDELELVTTKDNGDEDRLTMLLMRLYSNRFYGE